MPSPHWSTDQPPEGERHREKVQRDGERDMEIWYRERERERGEKRMLESNIC